MKQMVVVCAWSLVFTLFLPVFCWNDGGTAVRVVARQTLETLAPKAAQNLALTKLFFGQPIVFSAEIAAESGISAQELRLVYKFLGDTKIDVPYLPMQAGMRIPGYARKVDVEIIRVQSDAKREKIVLWKQIFEPEQIPPDFILSQMRVEPTSRAKSTLSSECAFTVRTIKVDFAKPVDAQGENVITALVDDLQVSEPSIDTAATHLAFETAGKIDNALTQAIKPANITCTGFFNNGFFLINAVIGKLPKVSLKGKTLRGTLGLRLSVTLLNRRASRSAAKEETIRVPILLTF
ncbi:MAG: hypothetical protein EAZ92_01235 [Candidatus Kapaibacterium sp.]|nr:MAG: hypothetical protein EAZ92_01235 [Candidatus Kapabacteria bacterium]